MNPTILLTGRNGQVGSALLPLLPRLGKVVALGRGELDLADPDAIRRAVRELRPQIIVNAAGYTQVDQAETDAAAAYAMNAEAPRLFAEEAKQIGAALVHYSTDYVFDGLKESPYLETDPPNPVNVYGKSKLAGEQAVQSSGVPHLILRTSWVYARRGRNFLLTILRLSTQRVELRIVADQTGAPTSSDQIAAGTVRILAHILDRGVSSASFARFSGTYHMTAGGETSWYDFAQAILEGSAHIAPDAPWYLQATGGHPRMARRVVPITTADYPTPARRPAYSVLSNARLRSTFGFELPDWRTQLTELLEGPRREEPVQL